MEGWRQRRLSSTGTTWKRLGKRRNQKKKKKKEKREKTERKGLTLSGLLMEGVDPEIFEDTDLFHLFRMTQVILHEFTLLARP
jgi:hypothetical protein